jgi:hypothetical protein
MHRDRHRIVPPRLARRDDTTEPELILEAAPRRMTRREADRTSIVLLVAIVIVLAAIMFAALAISACEARRSPQAALSAIEGGDIHTIVAPASGAQEAR